MSIKAISSKTIFEAYSDSKHKIIVRDKKVSYKVYSAQEIPKGAKKVSALQIAYSLRSYIKTKPSSSDFSKAQSIAERIYQKKSTSHRFMALRNLVSKLQNKLHGYGFITSREIAKEVMDAKIPLTPLSESNLTTKEYCEQASALSNLQEANKIYESAFRELRARSLTEGNTNSLAITQDLVELLESYAGKICYAQESSKKDKKGNSLDEEKGFRKSARLMELSLCMTYNALGIKTESHDWSAYHSLKTLTKSLNTEKDQQGKYFSTVSHPLVDNKVLAEVADEKGLREIMAKSFIRLTYSYQNISTLNASTKPNYQMHQNLNELTETLIDKSTEESNKMLVNYRYNRCAFIAGLNSPEDWEGKIESYRPVQELALKTYPEGSLDLASLLAQIANMRGLIVLNSKEPEALEKAEDYFQEAFDLRKNLMDLCTTCEGRDKQEFLMANLRTGIIHCLLNRQPRTKELYEEANVHAEALAAYIEKCKQNGNKHYHRPNYANAITKVAIYGASLEGLLEQKIDNILGAQP